MIKTLKDEDHLLKQSDKVFNCSSGLMFDSMVSTVKSIHKALRNGGSAYGISYSGAKYYVRKSFIYSFKAYFVNQNTILVNVWKYLPAELGSTHGTVKTCSHLFRWLSTARWALAWYLLLGQNWHLNQGRVAMVEWIQSIDTAVCLVVWPFASE